MCAGAARRTFDGEQFDLKLSRLIVSMLILGVIVIGCLEIARSEPARTTIYTTIYGTTIPTKMYSTSVGENTTVIRTNYPTVLTKIFTSTISILVGPGPGIVTRSQTAYFSAITTMVPLTITTKTQITVTYEFAVTSIASLTGLVTTTITESLSEPIPYLGYVVWFLALAATVGAIYIRASRERRADSKI